MSTIPTQNIYDNPAFFAAYSQLPRSQHGLAGAPEWPTLRRMVRDVQGLRVLDLGCGYGWFCRWARDHGAKSVHGIDVSERMLARAREFDEEEDQKNEKSGCCTISYERADLDLVRLPDGGVFDLVYSNLALHYLSDLPRLVDQIYATLAPRGRFVFSVEHPINTAPTVEHFWRRADNGEFFDPEAKNPNPNEEKAAVPAIWQLNAYSREGLRTTKWLVDDGVRKYHRTIETYVSLLLQRGFELTELVEWAPGEELFAKKSSVGGALRTAAVFACCGEEEGEWGDLIYSMCNVHSEDSVFK
ncbi:hypothetical protein VTN77DRAFT_8728 [Rasamsonia byssochlamydoides]|uniref:uncharacterized protein n=1 Tax=Rasamsonia byssochlamydoides TaxID=89139 RepID=UPI003744796C